jgi:hypothetical protein
MGYELWAMSYGLWAPDGTMKRASDKGAMRGGAWLRPDVFCRRSSTVFAIGSKRRVACQASSTGSALSGVFKRVLDVTKSPAAPIQRPGFAAGDLRRVERTHDATSKERVRRRSRTSK